MRPARTINQINSFCERNPILAAYLKFKDVRNLTIDKAWFEYTKSELFRPIGRYTLRGNFMYANLIKSVSAFVGINLDRYNYERDTIKIEIEDTRYTVRMDVIDGVTIEYTLPIKGPYYETQTFKKHRFHANVPFEKELIRPYINRIHAGHFFPENTILGKLQRKCRLTKAQAVAEFKKYRRDDFIKVNHVPAEEVIERSLTRRLRKKFNIHSEVPITLAIYLEIMKRSRSKTRIYVRKLNVSAILDSQEFDGDVDEAFDRLQECFEENTLYV